MDRLGVVGCAKIILGVSTYRAEGAAELIVGCFGFANGAEHPSADGMAKRSGSSERMRLIPMDAIMSLPTRACNGRIIR